MITIQIEAGKLKPNPFKKEINKGKLNAEGIKKMEESIDKGTLPEIFTARQNGNNSKKDKDNSNKKQRRSKEEEKKIKDGGLK